ncbi:lyase family protein, partial [Paenibacillus jilunlii]|uniref:lyase family protein n=1 Tax=Paenibacillus jilunlii TaxID=682956 RepID=UPI00200FDC2D
MTGLHGAFVRKAEEFDDIIEMGRTHLQDAVPIRLGQAFAAYARMLDRDLVRIRQTKFLLYEINMGAPAVGPGLNADPRYIRKLLQLLVDIRRSPVENSEHMSDDGHIPDDKQRVQAWPKVG